MSRGSSGRPVRFFGLVMAGWIAIRLAGFSDDMAGPATDSDVGKAPPQLAQTSFFHSSARTKAIPSWQARPSLHRNGKSALRTAGSGGPIPQALMTPPAMPFMPNDGKNAASASQAVDPGPAINSAPALPLTAASQERPGRWHGSAWTLWRDGSATNADAVPGGRLGGSQMGLRVDLDLTPGARSRTVAYGRISAAMNRPASPEAALGLGWQPVRVIPISFAAERRVALGHGARNANAVLVAGGFGPAPVAPSLEVEAYAQAGMVGFRSRDVFADGKMSLLSPIKGTPIRLGASLSGGAQPQVERLDIGPELQIRLPIPQIPARLTIEWRERIAGHAAPASGLAITLGADF